jgi:hypothetical protein
VLLRREREQGLALVIAIWALVSTWISAVLLLARRLLRVVWFPLASLARLVHRPLWLRRLLGVWVGCRLQLVAVALRIPS